MKKLYSKPAIAFENFAMSTNIAGDCKTIIDNQSSGNCAYFTTDEFGTVYHVFVGDVQACTTHEADGEYDSVCYQVPYGESLFNS